MVWALSDIRRKVRQVTGRLSSNELNLTRLDEYINNYYQYTFPSEVKLERNHTYYEFNTTPFQRDYTLPSNYTNFEPPLYINYKPLLWYQDPTVFYQENWLQISSSTPWTGDGSTTAFSTTISLTSSRIYHGSVIINDDVETFTDDGSGVLTGSDGGTGTIDYTSGAVSVTFNTAPTSGENIYLSEQQYTPGEPTAVLLYNNVFQLYPIPDTVYRARIKAYEVPLTLTLATDTPELQEWGPCIALGASRDILVDFGEIDQYRAVTELYKEQVSYILQRTIQNLSNERSRSMF